MNKVTVMMTMMTIMMTIVMTMMMMQMTTQVMERSLELAIWDHDRIGKTQDFLGGARFDILINI